MLTTRSSLAATQPIFQRMGRSVIGLCAGFGCLVGGYVPVLWGAGSFSLASLAFGGLGAAAGIWLGVRLSEV